MDAKFLKLKPVRFLCPFCGEWHECNGSKSFGRENVFHCSTLGDDDFYFSSIVDEHTLNLTLNAPCDVVDDIDIEMPIDELNDGPVITFTKHYKIFSNKIGCNSDYCNDYCDDEYCYFAKSAYERRFSYHDIKFGFQFDISEFNQLALSKIRESEKSLSAREKALSAKEKALLSKDRGTIKKETVLPNQESQLIKKELRTMKEGNILKQFYYHSPEENIKIFNEWAEQYKPVLRWAVPVVSIYAAYQILNSQNNISIKNLESICQENFGFVIEPLRDKKRLRQLSVLGKSTAAAYTAMKVASSIFTESDVKNLSKQEVEESLTNLEKLKSKFSFLQPTTEDLLPVALSIITVFVVTNKDSIFESKKIPQFLRDFAENISATIEVYSSLASSFIKEKFNIDLSTEKGKQKLKTFCLFATIILLGVFLYGKRILQNRKLDDELPSENVPEGIKQFVSHLISIMKKLAPSAFAILVSFLVANFECDKALLEDIMDDDTITENTVDVTSQNDNENSAPETLIPSVENNETFAENSETPAENDETSADDIDTE